jgi:flagellar assembly factor FliW
MPQCETKYFGTVSYDASAAVEFPAGLPGFENCRRFLPIEEAARRPLIFMQSLEQPGLCFLTLLVAAIDPGYRLKMSAEDMASVGFDRQPGTGAEMVCLAVMSIANAAAPTVNLLAPIVVNPRTGRAVQSVRDDAVYPCRQPLAGAPELAPCS